jgi:hypothetical protein
MIDIIIPTMLLSDKDIFSYTLSELDASPHVQKIIVLDNTKDKKFKDNFSCQKLDLIENGKNIYVNPAWNLGMSRVNSDHYIILNDDILCHRNIFKIANEYMTKNQNLGILTFKTVQNMPIEKYKEAMIDLIEKKSNITLSIPNNRIGWFMCGRKKDWVDIPNSLKIWFGDDYIYMLARMKNKKCAMCTPHFIVHYESTTLTNKDHKSDFKTVIQADKKAWPNVVRSVKQCLL